MYLHIAQTFSVWFVPGYAANVNLVTVLDLVHCVDSGQGDWQPLPEAQQQAKANGANGSANANANANNTQHRVGYKIKHQEDLYQVNEFLKFVLPCVGAVAWDAWQLFSTIMCVLGVLMVASLTAVVRRLSAVRAPHPPAP
jgi:hypothetical protein